MSILRIWVWSQEAVFDYLVVRGSRNCVRDIYLVVYPCIYYFCSNNLCWFLSGFFHEGIHFSTVEMKILNSTGGKIGDMKN